MKNNQPVEYTLPLFEHWSHQKIEEYAGLYIDDFRDNPSAPPRKGVPPGQEYPFSLTKYQTAIYSVLYSQKLTRFSLQAILQYVKPKPSPGLYRVWRSEGRFKLLVEELRGQYALHVAQNIIYAKAEGCDPDEPTMPRDGLKRKIRFISEAVNYSPDLLEKISVEMSKLILSKDKKRSISDYLGHHIFCILMLYGPTISGKKSRQRAIYTNVCKKIIGHHWQDDFLTNYLEENTHAAWSPEVWKTTSFDQGTIDGILERDGFISIRNMYYNEFAAIMNSEIIRLCEPENTIELKKDLIVGINFLANIYPFRSRHL